MIKIIFNMKGEYRWLSNFGCSPFVYKGDKFENTEQFFQHAKATYFGDHETAAQILNAPKPSDNKKLGQQVKNFDPAAWRKVNTTFMWNGLVEKFTQNPDLKKKLIETGAAILIEGNDWNDLWWGWDFHTGEGENILGQLLMLLRTSLRNDIPINLVK